MCADDTPLYYSFHPDDVAGAVEKLHEDSWAISRFSQNYSLEINFNQNQFLVFGKNQTVCSVKNCTNIKINNHMIGYANKAKNLEIIMDNFRFQEQDKHSLL